MFSKGNLRLIDGDELVDLIFEHYEALDPRYKEMIPLKRVYVPEALTGPDSGTPSKSLRLVDPSASG